MSVQSIIGNAASQLLGIGHRDAQPQGVQAAPKDDFASILDAFRKEAAKSPAERARDDVLKRHNLSEQDYSRLPDDQKKAIDREIAQAVQRALRVPGGGTAQASATPGSLPGFLS